MARVANTVKMAGNKDTPGFNPTKFVIQASNNPMDPESFVDLHSVSTNWKIGEEKEIKFKNTTKYLIYRVNVKAVKGYTTTNISTLNFGFFREK